MLNERLRVDKKIRAFYERYERLLVPGLLIIGFVFDLITFQALSMITTMKVLGAYAAMAALTLFYLHVYDGRKILADWTILRYLRALSPFVIQLTFGALLSSSLLFYWYGGALSVSWPLLAVITGLMISSELFRRYYLKPIVLFSVYTFLLLSYLSLLLPFVFSSLSGWIFILSSLLSLTFVMMLLMGLSGFARHILLERAAMITAIIGVIVSMNIMYFFNLIPPLPLAIREAGVYHALERVDNELILTGEDETFWQSLVPGQTLHWTAGESLYVYTRIFAPAKIKTEIYHHWEYYNDGTHEWESSGRLHFSVRGGRPEGYRGYTQKSHLAYGKWRVTVETQRGQVLGRVTFVLVEPDP